jgi:hypothetical protein
MSPSERVLKKAFWLTFIGCLCLVWYRHIELGFDTYMSVISTAGFSFMIMAIIGILGGAMAGSFYEMFLKAVDATNEKSSVIVFIVECVWALFAPVFAVVGLFFLSGAEHWASWG